MFKRAWLVVALLAAVAPAALCQTSIKVDSKKVTYMVPTGIFVPQGQTITINATGTVTLTDPDGAGSFTVNAIGVIQTAPDEDIDPDFYDFLTDEALPPLEPPSPGKLKFPPGDTGATLIGAYGALVLGLSPNQCGATSAADFPHGFINPGTGAGPLPVSGGYIYLGVQRDEEVTATGTYAVTISLSGSASPPLGCSGAMEALDPVPNFLVSTGIPAQPYAITMNQSVLTSGGRAVEGVAADGVTQVLVRSRGMDTSHVNVVVLVDENGQTAPANGEDGTLLSPFGGSVTAGSAVIPAIQNVNGINYIFVTYQSPIDYARAAGSDNTTASRKIAIVLFDVTSNSVVALAQLNLLRPPIFFVHGLWSGPSTWNQFDVALSGALPGLDTYRADFAADNGKSVSYNTPNVLLQAYYNLNAFRKKENAAAAQLDFIVHSMGGLISDTMPTLPLFKTSMSYGRGPIHKLITIDTPYLGSQLAVGVANSNLDCWGILKLGGAEVDGAIADLIPTSPFLKTFNPVPAGYAKHAIASYVTEGQATGAEIIVNGLFVTLNLNTAIKALADSCKPVFVNGAGVGPPNFTFQNYFLTPGDEYGGASDLIVSERSELADQFSGTTADITSGLAHSNIPIPFLNINIPGSLDAGVGDPTSNNLNALRLLNSPTKGTSFIP